MAFDTAAWIDRLAAAFDGLEKAQEPYLQAYWERHPRKQLIVDGRDETLFPLDDLRMVYASARHSRRFGTKSEYAPLSAALDPTRHVLLSHPELERVAVAGRNVGENDFWMGILNQGMSISAGDLIAGLMARAAELRGKGFRTAARELNAFLSGAGGGAEAAVLVDLDLGGLVQQQATPRADRRHATGRERGRVLSETGSVGHGGLTQTNQPPVNPDRFNAAFEQDVFDLAQRQRIADVHHHCEADDLGRTVEITKGIVHGRRLRELGFRFKPVFSDSAQSG